MLNILLFNLHHCIFIRFKIQTQNFYLAVTRIGLMVLACSWKQCKMLMPWCLSVGQVWLEKRYVGSKHTSEWFNTAGRNVKTGLIASVIVSQVQSLACKPFTDFNGKVLFLEMILGTDCSTFVLKICAVDLGCYNLAKFKCCLGVWSKWTFLVC